MLGDFASARNARLVNYCEPASNFMKIGILIAGLPPEVLGGAETQATETAVRLAARHEVRVFTRNATIPEALRARPGCAVVRRSRVRWRGLRFGFDLCGSLLCLWRHRQALDVLLAYQTVIDGLIAVIAARLWSIPTLVWVRSEVEFSFADSRQARLLSPWVFRHADAIAVQSALLRDALLAALRAAGHDALAAAVEAKIHVIANGVEVDKHVLPGDRRELLYVGRLATDKGVINLLEALRHCPALQLTIVGEGPQRAALEAAARGLANVHFAGRCAPAEIPAHMARAGILVLPSLRNEGLPNVLLEAMAGGLVVIASRNAGIPDLITDGESGLLVAPGDVAALAAALKRVSEDELLRLALRRRAREAVRRYAWPQVIEKLEQCLLKLVTARRL